MLVERIGEAAMLEQTAEEATELAFVCLKMARMLRGDNKVHGRTWEELSANLEEEVADLCLCFDELNVGKLINGKTVNNWYDQKVKRMEQRLKEDADEQQVS